jgi:LPS-assembly protein
LTKNLEVRLNVDYASDYRYKKDFKDFNMIDKLPDMDPDKNDFIAELRVNYYTRYADFSVKYRDSMQYYDTPEGYSKDHIYQKPSFQVEKYGLDASIIKIDYLVDFNSVENRLSHYRYDLNDESYTYTYDRFNSKLKIYKPIDLKFATFTPFYTQYYTHWYNFNHNLNSFSDHEQTFLDVDVHHDSATRKIYSFGGSLNINEIYKDYKYFRHSLYNTFEYIQTPYAEQSSLPDYIENDKISESKIYSYTMTNYLKGENFSLKLQLIQGYDLTLPKNRFTPFHEKLTIKYLDTFGFYLESKYNYYSDKIEYYKNDFSIDLSNYYINFSQSFDRTIQDTDNAIMGIKVGARFTKWDFEVYKKIGKRINNFSYDPTNLSGREFHTKILYKSECWSLGFLYKEDSYDELKTTGYDNNKNRTFMVLIELRGIGATQKEIYKL